MRTLPSLALFFTFTFPFTCSQFYYQHWCGQAPSGIGLDFLDDQKCQKVFPSKFNRDFSCDVESIENEKDLIVKGFVEDGRPLSEIKVDTDTLHITTGANVCLIVSFLRVMTLFQLCMD